MRLRTRETGIDGLGSEGTAIDAVFGKRQKLGEIDAIGRARMWRVAALMRQVVQKLVQLGPHGVMYVTQD